MFESIKRIFARRVVRPPQQERHLIALSPGKSDAGVYVTPDKALGCSTAWACGTLIARSIAMLPAHVLAPRSGDDADGNERLPDHPIESLLHRAANPEMTAFQFREQMLLSCIFHGNAYAEIERDQMGRPFALWPIHPERVSVCRDENGALFYEVYNGVEAKSEIPPERMFHLAGPSLCGPVGLSVVSYARQTLGLALAQEFFAGSFIKNRAAPSGIVTVTPGLTADGFKRLRSEFDALHSGSRKAGSTIFTDGMTEWTPISVTMEDAEFLEQRRFSVEEVARFFGVPPQMIGVQDKQTLNNYEQAALQFHQLAVLPWVVRWEQEANKKLLPKVGNRRPFLKINTAAIVRANLEAQYRAFALGRQWGWLSVNDIRRLIDAEPIGEDGDVYLQPTSMTPISEGSSDDEGDDRQRAHALALVR